MVHEFIVHELDDVPVILKNEVEKVRIFIWRLNCVLDFIWQKNKMSQGKQSLRIKTNKLNSSD